jgi:hypothetical protein
LADGVARLLLLVLLAASLPALAEEVEPLQEDPFDVTGPAATPVGEVSLTLTGQYLRDRSGRRRDTGVGTLELETGVAPGLDLRFLQSGAYGRAAPRDAEDSAPSWGGVTQLGLRWEIAEERGPWPAFGVFGAGRIEYGRSTPVTEFDAVALLQKTLRPGELPLGAWFNLGWTARLDPLPGERPGRYFLAAALGQTVARDTQLSLTYLLNQQERGERDLQLVEGGIRHRLADRQTILGAAVAAGIGRDSPALQVTFTVKHVFGGN